jgi:RNA ligase
MSISRKYGRTFHYPFSPGITGDDRVNADYWQDLHHLPSILHTEKLDGENNCVNRYGVFARSHAAPTTSPWTRQLNEKWNAIKNDLGDYEIFGENLYAIHSIQYPLIKEHYYVFGVRDGDKWLSWEETVFIASVFDFPVVPVIGTVSSYIDQHLFEKNILAIAANESWFKSIDIHTNQPCSMEGIVSRNPSEYGVNDFQQNVFKYVREGHVKTDEHWTRNWKRAPLKFETNVDANKK